VVFTDSPDGQPRDAMFTQPNDTDLAHSPESSEEREPDCPLCRWMSPPPHCHGQRIFAAGELVCTRPECRAVEFPHPLGRADAD